MAGKIPDETLQAIRERVSIVEVVSGHVTLRKAGKNHLGLCPFHTEKTPSFTVSDERGLFHCFGCGAGGTVFTFLMRADRVTFPEAVEILARRAGVTLPKTDHRSDGGEQRQELLRLNEFAQRCFREALQSPTGAAAREYLEKRGLSAATIEHYGLGFCPPNGSGLARALAPKPVATQKAIELGLLGRRANGTTYERLWGRVTFPIRDGSGQLRGFGGRTVGDQRPKYLNSPESSLFQKGQVLYGIYEARQAVQQAERLVIVEGYLDALALVEAGIGYAVASLGTALGQEQLKRARRFAPEVIVFFDGDRAGQEAAARAFRVCCETAVWGRGAFLPDGFDPDTFVRTHGPRATLAIIEQAEPLADFFFRRHDPGLEAAVPQRVRAAQEIGAVVNLVRDHDPILYSVLVRNAAQLLGVDEGVFREARTSDTSTRKWAPGSPTGAPREEFLPEEMTLIEAMALERAVAVLVSQRDVLRRLRSAELAEAGAAVLASWERHGTSTPAVDQLPAPLAERVTRGLLGEGPMASGDRSQTARDCIAQIERRARRSRSRELRADLSQAEARGGDSTEQLRRANEDLLRRKELGHE